ncbi:MAG TPA: hypothetical protein VF483_06145 [Gemmatimonadaceae bacterium]
MRLELVGRARVLGDDVNTDYIISSRRKKDTIDASKLKAFLLEAVDPAFAASVQANDVLVAGRNFGCGSAMEVAVTVIRAAGIRAVVARSFSRSFYRNAVNNGLLPLECDTSQVREGDRLSLRVADNAIELRDITTGQVLTPAPLPQAMQQILDAGGLVGFVRQRGTLRP